MLYMVSMYVIVVKCEFGRLVCVAKCELMLMWLALVDWWFGWLNVK